MAFHQCKSARSGEEISLDNREKAIKAACIAIDKKAVNTIILDLKGLSSITDYFVICTGENPVQIKAIAEDIEKAFSSINMSLLGKEGLTASRWVLMDYGDFIVHIFNKETRDYFELERLWKDAPQIDLQLAC
jgi:ribosome-associated protein